MLKEAVKPWYKNHWPWILITGPVLVIFALLITAWLAISSYDGLINDDLNKTNLSVDQYLKQKEVAKVLDLSFELILTDDGESLRLKLSGLPNQAFSDLIYLNLIHPTRSGKDQKIIFKRRGSVFLGKVTQNLETTEHWNVVISDPILGWRIERVWRARK